MRESRRPPSFKCSVPRSFLAPGNAFFIIRPDGSDGPNKPNRPNEANRDDKPNGPNGTNGMDMAVMLADACGWLLRRKPAWNIQQKVRLLFKQDDGLFFPRYFSYICRKLNIYIKLSYENSFNKRVRRQEGC